MSARQVVRDSKGFKGRVLACQSESSAFFYLPSLPRASGPPDLSKFWTSPRFEEKNSMLGKLCTSAPPDLSKFWTSPRFEEKNSMLGKLCTSAPPNSAAKFGQVPDNQNKRQSSCFKARALPFLFVKNCQKSPKITKKLSKSFNFAHSGPKK